MNTVARAGLGWEVRGPESSWDGRGGVSVGVSRSWPAVTDDEQRRQW